MSAGVEAAALADGVRQGDPRAIARAISAIENHESGADALLRELFPHTGRALLIGVTGAPGTGKSSLVNRLAGHYRGAGRRVGILAVDPTSPFTGGALLGDRIRMQQHATDDGIYIRSMATRGYLGGLARATADAALVLDAAGKDVILIETVGVGQDEVDIVRLADATLLLLVAGLGDDVQNFKAGVMEIADVFVINKADRGDTDRLEAELKAMLSLSQRRDGWQPPVVKTVATEGTGVAELAAALERFFAQLDRDAQRVERWQQRLLDLIRQQALERVLEAGVGREQLADYARQIVERRRDPYSVVSELLRDAGMTK
ncbi:MAG TPA: methylmalonyl Co-A mutase-associated GTPase MeaB [Candidatus Xenobia bacterium]|nr:methylmalonyl Co-A mutase-associated GTPase MeaB [Candidatus Xenobia bacterium]